MSMINQPNRMVFFQPETNNVFDEAVDKGNGYVGRYSGLTLTSAEAQGARLMTEEEASKLIDAAYIRAPKPCSEERFMEMLEVLPPQDWQHSADGESFKLQERTAGNITLIMVRMGDAYWEMQDMTNLSHSEICAKVAQFFNVTVLTFQGKAMAMRAITADFDGDGERNYLIGNDANSDLLMGAMESDDDDDSCDAASIDDVVYFYTDTDVLWGDESALIEHIKASERYVSQDQTGHTMRANCA